MSMVDQTPQSTPSALFTAFVLDPIDSWVSWLKVRDCAVLLERSGIERPRAG